MNLYALVILVALVGTWVLELLADALNLKHFPREIPGEFVDTYSEDDYSKSKCYLRDTTTFSWVSGGASLAALLAFWQLGGFPWLDGQVRSFAGGGFLDGPVWHGLLFTTGLMVIRLVFSLPFSIYDTFVIEERFGFNKTTARTFCLDIVKSLFLGLLLGWPLLAALLWFFETTGDRAWIYCWAVVVAFSLLLQYIAPTWIMPLFNKFTPLEEGQLKDRICAFAEKVGFPLRGVYILDGSRRTAKGNAFFTGFGKNKRIALYDTLIEKQSEDQLVAVLAHEIGHYKKRHITIRMAIGIIHSGVMLFLLGKFLGSDQLFAAFGFEYKPVYAGLIFFALLFTPVDLVLGIFMNWLSRLMEFQADRFAIENCGDTEALATALKKLSKDSLSQLSPHPLEVILHYSHPPIIERLSAMRGENRTGNS